MVTIFLTLFTSFVVSSLKWLHCISYWIAYLRRPIVWVILIACKWKLCAYVPFIQWGNSIHALATNSIIYINQAVTPWDNTGAWGNLQSKSDFMIRLASSIFYKTGHGEGISFSKYMELLPTYLVTQILESYIFLIKKIFYKSCSC